MASQLLDGIQLAASDLDGTLLLGGTKTVRPEAFPIIERFCDAGGYFFAASGRQYASLRWLFEPVADRIGYVCENGAMAIWRGDIVMRQTMDRSLMLEIFNFARCVPGCSVLVSGTEHAYALEQDANFIEYLVNVVGNDVVPIKHPEDMPEETIKVAFMVEPEMNEKVRVLFETVFSNQCKVVTSGADWIDLLVHGVNKGSALAAISRELGVPIKDMAAFGDAENDREMLELVGHPYLMDPCAESMLDIAEHANIKRCTCVEDELQRLMGEVS